MKVLFVCHQNVGRSQMAKGFYNYLTHTQDANSAGTAVMQPGQTLLERKAQSSSKSFFIFEVMDEEGIDMRRFVRTPLTEDMLGKYDKIICMEKRHNIPNWLLNSSTCEFWDIADPRGLGLEHLTQTRNTIKQHVQDLISKN